MDAGTARMVAWSATLHAVLCDVAIVRCGDKSARTYCTAAALLVDSTGRGTAVPTVGSLDCSVPTVATTAAVRKVLI
jgi:hypothetical protein